MHQCLAKVPPPRPADAGTADTPARVPNCGRTRAHIGTGHLQHHEFPRPCRLRILQPSAFWPGTAVADGKAHCEETLNVHLTPKSAARVGGSRRNTMAGHPIRGGEAV